MSEKKVFDFGSDDANINPTPIINPVPNNEPPFSPPPPNAPMNTDFNDNAALTVEEKEDPSRVIVEITDSAPIIIMFGAKTSGKTMTLVRLSRYLKGKGFIVDPIRTFRPSNSMHYQEMCDSFNSNIFSSTAPEGTAALSFMLVKVSNKYGDPICQILEAPGEHYFDPEKENTFPPYIMQIVQNDNPKTWLFITELDWKDNATRLKYAEKVKEMRNIINSSDKVILMCHKADRKPSYYYKGSPDKRHFYRDIKQQYPAIFMGHETSGLKKLFTPYDMKFVVFSAGHFTEGKPQTYSPGNDKFPAELWRNIYKTVKGSWF